MLEREELTRRTYRWDRVRGAANGVEETAYMALALVIAIEVFHAPHGVKGVIAAAAPLGLFLNPISLTAFSRLGIPASRLASGTFALAGILMLTAAAAQTLYGFLIPTCLAFVAGAQTMPLMVHIWTSNYPSTKRGAYLAVSMMFTIAATFGFSLLGGWLLDYNLAYFRTILLAVAAAYLLSGFAVWQIPSTPLSRRETENPLRNLSYAITDARFGIMLLSWMLMGFGNLMALPLRVEYLLQEEYGIRASKTAVAVVTLGLPAAMRFLTSRFWGALFDRIDFMIMRIVLNGLIMLSIFLFFTTTNLLVIGLAAAILGAAMGGANISWSLWVTKFATPDRTAAYMSVHTFTTGIRGILAPFLGFYLISAIGAFATGVTGAALIALATVMVLWLFLSERRNGGAVRRGDQTSMAS